MYERDDTAGNRADPETTISANDRFFPHFFFYFFMFSGGNVHNDKLNNNDTVYRVRGKW